MPVRFELIVQHYCELEPLVARLGSRYLAKCGRRSDEGSPVPSGAANGLSRIAVPLEVKFQVRFPPYDPPQVY
jgi:hypothetical protein